MKKILTVLVAIALVAVWQLVMASPTEASGPNGYHGGSKYGQNYSGGSYHRSYNQNHNSYGYQYYKPNYTDRGLYGSYHYGGRVYNPGFTGQNKYYGSGHNNYYGRNHQNNCNYRNGRSVYQSNHYTHSRYNQPRNYNW